MRRPDAARRSPHIWAAGHNILTHDLGPDGLAVAVVRAALACEGPDWLRGPCGHWWAAVLSLEPEVLWRMAAPGIPFAPIGKCPGNHRLHIDKSSPLSIS